MSTLQDLSNIIENLTGIKKMVIVTRDGTVLLQNGDSSKRFGDYVAYAAITAEQVKPYLGFNGPYHMIMEQTSGDRILTLLNQQIIVGLDLDSHVSPAIILDRLSPVLEQINF